MTDVGATISIRDCARVPWGVIVVGAGPAGSVCATGLARMGVRTLLIDRSRFPRPKVCGGCLSGAADEMMRAHGLNEGPAWRWTFDGVCVSDGRRRATLWVPEGRVVRRDEFDASLVRMAIEAGAAFLPEASAVGSWLETAGRAVLVRMAGEDVTLQAKCVVVAAGLAGTALASQCGIETELARSSRMGVGAIVRDESSAYADRTVFMAVGASGYAGVVRVGDSHLIVAGAIDPAAMKMSGSAGAAVGALLGASGGARIEGLASARMLGTGRLTRRVRRVAGERAFAIGDAAGYVEPFTGEGMTWAIETGLGAVALAARAAERWDDRLANEWVSRHRQRIAVRHRACRAVAGLLRMPVLTSMAIGVLDAAPGMVRPLTSRMHSVGGLRVAAGLDGAS